MYESNQTFKSTTWANITILTYDVHYDIVESTATRRKLRHRRRHLTTIIYTSAGKYTHDHHKYQSWQRSLNTYSRGRLKTVTKVCTKNTTFGCGVCRMKIWNKFKSLNKFIQCSIDKISVVLHWQIKIMSSSS